MKSLTLRFLQADLKLEVARVVNVDVHHRSCSRGHHSTDTEVKTSSIGGFSTRGIVRPKSN